MSADERRRPPAAASTTLEERSRAGTLHVVATPIGNLEDITVRALRVLREVSAIAAEDTRRTAKLLAHYAIPTPTVSYHAHNSRTRLPQLLERLSRGEHIALVTDAGTPGVSDPGSELVAACHKQGIPVDPVPGVSAPLAAAVASGFPLSPLTIFGFVPSRSKDRIIWLREVLAVPHTCSFFETPHRVQATLSEIAGITVERPILVAREITKVHQELILGVSGDFSTRLVTPRGEFTVVLGPAPGPSHTDADLSDDDLVAEFGCLTDSGETTRRQAIAALAKRSGRSARDVYAVLERAKCSGE